MNKMGKNQREVIHEDSTMIWKTQYYYQKAVPNLQALIDELKAEDITITDTVLGDLHAGGGIIKKQIADDLEREAQGITLRHLKEKYESEKEYRTKLVSRCVTRLREALSVFEEHTRFDIRIEDFVCHNLTVSLKPDLDQQIAERFTLYTDNPVMAQAWEKAKALMDQIMDFEDFLRLHGDIMHPIQRENPYIFAFIPGLIMTSVKEGQYHLELNREGFRKIFTKISEPL